MKIIEEGKDYYEKIKILKKIKYFPTRWITFYLDESNGEKWVDSKPNSNFQGGGSSILTLVDEFPVFEFDYNKDEYFGQDVFHFTSERLELVKKDSDIRFYIDNSNNNKWIEENYSGKETDFDLAKRLRKVEKFPWE